MQSSSQNVTTNKRTPSFFFTRGCPSCCTAKSFRAVTAKQYYTAWWQRHMCVNNLPRVAFDNGEAGIRNRDLLIASPASQPLGHRATRHGSKGEIILWCEAMCIAHWSGHLAYRQQNGFVADHRCKCLDGLLRPLGRPVSRATGWNDVHQRTEHRHLRVTEETWLNCAYTETKNTPVMCSETVGLRTRPVWDQKKSVLVLLLQVWCCVVKHRLVTLVVTMILNDTATFQVLFIVSLFCAWNITTVEINSGVYLLKS